VTTSTSPLTASRDAALEYAARGWHVFPVQRGSKEPQNVPGVNVNGHLGATTDPDLIRRMWRDNILANVGIATGPSGLLVIDIDANRWKGKVGETTWKHLLLEQYPSWVPVKETAVELDSAPIQMDPPDEVNTYEVRTWSGGTHLFFLDPDGEVRNSTSKLGPDVDTRGAGGYVVAAPSVVSEDGHSGQYVLRYDRPLLYRPQWVVDALARPEPRQRRTGAPLAAQERVVRRVNYLADELREAPEGSGNDTAARVGYMAGQYVGAGQMDEEDAISILLDAVSGWNHQNPRGADALRATIERQVSEGMRNPRAWEEPISVTPRTIPAIPNSFAVPPSEDVTPPEEEKIDGGDDGKVVSMWATDNGQGIFLRDRVGDMRYAVGIGWLVWVGSHWKPVGEEYISNRVSRFYRQQFEKILAKWAAAPGEKKWEEIAKTYRAFMSSGRLKSILNHLKVTDGVLIDAAELDAHPELLNTKTGIVDLRTGAQRPHDQKMLFTKVTRAGFRPGFTHPDWDTALTALPVDIADYVQLRLGQAITGYTPEGDDAMFFMGGGSNGKTLLLSEGPLRVLGDYGALSQATLIGKQSGGSGPSPERVGLRGVRLAVIEELEEGRSVNVAELKRVIGTPTITARNLNEKEITFQCSHTLVVNTNYPPVVAEVDEGSWRRLCRVVFPFRFRQSPEGPMERKGDPGLKMRVREGQTGQHEAVLAWLVAGAVRYFADREAVTEDRRPAPIRQATLAWRKEADRILAYLDERIDFDSNAAVAKGDLFWDFSRFLEEGNHSKWTQETFFSRLAEHQRLRSAGVTQGQTRAVATLSRPIPPGTLYTSGMPTLKAAPRIFRGLKFKSE
jgi:putative DNA primase/helicase